jgi:hypothetical protein
MQEVVEKSINNEQDARLILAQRKVRRMSPDKNPAYQARLSIAVDKLSIANGPGQALLSKAEHTYSHEEGVKARFTVTTAASDCPTVLKAIVYEAYSIPTQETSWDPDGGVPSGEYRLSCLIQGEEFYGTYNPHTRTGELTADYWDPWDPIDPRNQP